MKKFFLSIGAFAFLLVLTGVGCSELEQMTNEQIEGEKIMVGGERDEHGCLGPAGYSWDEDSQVCTRSWEIKDEDQKKVVKIAVQALNPETGLTVVDIESEDCVGCYVVHFTNLDNKQIEVRLKNWELFTGAGLVNELSCELASDCACGKHIQTGECFFGNKELVNTEKQCPDYCSGVGGNLVLNCVENTCKQVETKEESEKIIEKIETPKPVAGISLSAKAVSDGVAFNWSVTGIDVSQGFKIVKSTETNPVYPGNDYVYLDNASTRNYTWNIKDGKTYYFRVCQYLGGKCGVYSQNVKVTAPLKETVKEKETTGNVSSISVKSTGGTGVAWTTVGTSSQGFKIVWSKNSNPTYPTRSGDKYIYLSDKNASATSLNAFDGSGTYYVRVCEYLGGKCGVYSNQITVEL